MTLDEALDAYWSAAYAEGKRGAAHDTPDGLAQTALMAVQSCVALLVGAERERCAQVCEDSDVFVYDDPGGFFAGLVRKTPNV